MDRLQIQALLEGLLGTEYVYFQPPASVKMTYPCIVYRRDNQDAIFADNKPYHLAWRYEATVIARNPDTDIPDKVAALPMCRLVTSFVSDNLNHYVFNLYF